MLLFQHLYAKPLKQPKLVMAVKIFEESIASRLSNIYIDQHKAIVKYAVTKDLTSEPCKASVHSPCTSSLSTCLGSWKGMGSWVLLVNQVFNRLLILASFIPSSKQTSLKVYMPQVIDSLPPPLSSRALHFIITTQTMHLQLIALIFLNHSTVLLCHP